MSTHDRASATGTSTLPSFVGIAAVVVVTGALAVVVGVAGRGDAAAGMETGGVLVALLAGLRRWPSVRPADRTGSTARIAASRADELDLEMRQSTIAVVGQVTLGVSGLASAASFLEMGATSSSAGCEPPGAGERAGSEGDQAGADCCPIHRAWTDAVMFQQR